MERAKRREAIKINYYDKSLRPKNHHEQKPNLLFGGTVTTACYAQLEKYHSPRINTKKKRRPLSRTTSLLTRLRRKWSGKTQGRTSRKPTLYALPLLLGSPLFRRDERAYSAERSQLPPRPTRPLPETAPV